MPASFQRAVLSGLTVFALTLAGAVLEAAYNDARGVSAAFNLNMLPHLNRLFRGNFDPGLFRRLAVYDGARHEVDVFFCCRRNHTVRLEGLGFQVELRRGERILVQISRKFEVDALRRQLESHRFEVRRVFTDPRRWFGLLLCWAVD